MIRRGEKPPCGIGVMGSERGSTETLALNGQTMDGVAGWLSATLDRHVLNKTGIEGKFIIYLEYTPDEHTPRLHNGTAFDPATSDPSGPNIFAALEKLGLKIEPTKGPKGYIVIDRAERPLNR
ncbi:MAG TPA: TIGR03435 family protein, partial [Vicinamibacterales bacterium]